MGIGFLEFVIIGVAALVLLGPKKLPEVMRQVARFYVQIRRTSNDFKSAFDHVVREAEDEFRQESGLSNLKPPSQFLNRLMDGDMATPTKADVALENDLSTQVLTPRSAEPFSWGEADMKAPQDQSSKPQKDPKAP